MPGPVAIGDRLFTHFKMVKEKYEEKNKSHRTQRYSTKMENGTVRDMRANLWRVDLELVKGHTQHVYLSEVKRRHESIFWDKKMGKIFLSVMVQNQARIIIKIKLRLTHSSVVFTLLLHDNSVFSLKCYRQAGKGVNRRPFL